MSLPAARPPREPLVPPGGVDLHARDMTATFSADVTLRAAQDRLRELNQWLPIDGHPDTALGTLVEQNSTGPLRLGYGAWHDLLLGVQFTNGRGELITAGGRTVKNVAGYDLTKFMVGSHGVFGRLVTMTTRTYRRPAGALLATASGAGPAAMTVLIPSSCRPHWAMNGMLGFLGDARTLNYYESAIRAYQARPLLYLKLKRQSLDEDVALRAAVWSAHRPGAATGGNVNFRASMPPAKLHRFMNPTTELWEAAADPAFGVIVGTCPPRRPAWPDLSFTGPPIIFYGPDGMPIRLHPDPVTLRLLRRLKAAFDPDNQLPPLPVEET